MMTPQQRKAVRVVVRLLVAGLVLGLASAALTIVFRDDVLAYQRGKHPQTDPGELARTLWTRPIPVVVVAVLYIWVARRLLTGAYRAYRRIRIVSIAGFAAVAWLFLSGEYPAWLRAVQAAQLAVLGALIVAVNRPVVRAAFPRVPDTRPRNRRAALLLAVLAPLVAEATLGTVPLRMAWALLVFAPVYSGGALLIREVVRRTGGGYPSLLLMGVVYGLVEEGLALQSLTSPHLYNAAAWAPRPFGINTAYAELNLVYHAVFSIAVPVAVTELCFPAHGRAPYLRRGGVIAAGIVALLGAGLLRVAVPPGEDPGYAMPLPAVLTVAALAVILTVVALRLPARRSVRPSAPAAPPRSVVPAAEPSAAAAPPRSVILAARTSAPAVPPRSVVPAARTSAPAVPPRSVVLGLLTAAATLAFLGAIWPFGGARQPLFTHGAWALLPMAGAAAVACATALALGRWSASPSWTRRHSIAACAGALAGHTVFGLTARAHAPADRIFLAAVVVLTVAAAVAAGRRAAPRPGAAPDAATDARADGRAARVDGAAARVEGPAAHVPGPAAPAGGHGPSNDSVAGA